MYRDRTAYADQRIADDSDTHAVGKPAQHAAGTFIYRYVRRELRGTGDETSLRRAREDRGRVACRTRELPGLADE